MQERPTNSPCLGHSTGSRCSSAADLAGLGTCRPFWNQSRTLSFCLTGADGVKLMTGTCKRLKHTKKTQTGFHSGRELCSAAAGPGCWKYKRLHHRNSFCSQIWSSFSHEQQAHSEKSKTELTARENFATPQLVPVLKAVPDRKEMGKVLKQHARVRMHFHNPLLSFWVAPMFRDIEAMAAARTVAARGTAYA